MDPRIRLIERLKIQLKGHVYVGDKKEDGWEKPLPYFAFKCPKHGIVYDYPHGHKQRLECPLCRKERNEESRNKLKEQDVPTEDYPIAYENKVTT